HQQGADTRLDRGLGNGGGRRALRNVRDMEQAVASKHSFLWAAGGRSKRLTQQFPEIFWHRVGSDRAELLAVIGHQGTVRGSTERVRLLQYRIEHRDEIAG